MNGTHSIYLYPEMSKKTIPSDDLPVFITCNIFIAEMLSCFVLPAMTARSKV